MERSKEVISVKPCTFTLTYYQYSKLLCFSLDMKDTAISTRLEIPHLSPEELADLPLSQRGSYI
jgi:hypothetical protein